MMTEDLREFPPPPLLEVFWAGKNHQSNLNFSLRSGGGHWTRGGMREGEWKMQKSKINEERNRNTKMLKHVKIHLLNLQLI